MSTENAERIDLVQICQIEKKPPRRGLGGFCVWQRFTSENFYWSHLLLCLQYHQVTLDGASDRVFASRGRTRPNAVIEAWEDVVQRLSQAVPRSGVGLNELLAVT